MPVAIAIVVAIALVIVALVAFIATRPADFRIQRSAEVGAPPDVVFGMINDLHQWDLWSPFNKYDPNVKKTYDGPESGPGASYAWDGNGQAGAGRMTIVAAKPRELVTMKLEFSRPFKSTNEVNFKLQPSGRNTRVSWIMDGKYNFMSKAMCLFINMDEMVGKDFAEGLANLNKVVQAAPASPA